MRVKLSVMNRLSLLGLLPGQGDLTTIKIIRELREELSFTSDEHAALGFKPMPDGKIVWNEEALSDREFEFEGIREVIIEGVKTQLRTMEEKKTLKLDHLSLYEVLIKKKEEEEKFKIVKKEEEDIQSEPPKEDLGEE